MKKRILSLIPFLAIAVLLLVLWAFTAQAQEPGEEPMAEPEGHPPRGVLMVGAPPSMPSQEQPPPERGQRPPSPTGGEMGAMSISAQEFAPPGDMGGPFEQNFLFDDVEGASMWTATGLWHVVNGSSPYPNKYSGAKSWWFGQDSTGNYDTGAQAYGTLRTTNPITIPAGARAAWLRYWSWELTENTGTQWDTRKVKVMRGGTLPLEQYVEQSQESYGQWRMHLVDLSSFTHPTWNTPIYLQFEFDSVDEGDNAYRGWYLDDIAVGYDDIQVAVDTDSHPSISYQTDPYVMYGLPGQQVQLQSLSLWNYTGTSQRFTTEVTCDWTVIGSWQGPPFLWQPSSQLPAGDYALKTEPFQVQVPATAPVGTYKDVAMVSHSDLGPTPRNTTTARVYVGNVHHVSHQITDDGSGQSRGNGNGQIDPGERIEMVVNLKNDTGQLRSGVYAKIDDNQNMAWSDDEEKYGDIQNGAAASSVGKYVFEVPRWMLWGAEIQFNMYSICDTSGCNWSDTFTDTVSALGLSARAGASPVNHHSLRVYNNTGTTTAFTLSVSDNTWPTTVYPTVTISLGNGYGTKVTVTVDVPASANPGDEDGALLKAASVVSPNLSACGHISTTRMITDWVQIYCDDSRAAGTADAAYLAVIQSMNAWQVSEGHNQKSNPAVTARRYNDTVAYAWQERRNNIAGDPIDEVLFGARKMDGSVAIAVARLADHYNDTTTPQYTGGAAIADRDPSIAWVPTNGKVVIAWERYHKVGTTWLTDIYYAIYDISGTLVVSPTNLTNFEKMYADGSNPSVEAFHGGKVAVVWEGRGNEEGVILDANGNSLTPRFNLPYGDDLTLSPLRTSNKLLLTYRASDNEVHYDTLDSVGKVASGGTWVYGVHLPANQTLNQAPDAANLSDGRILLAWSSHDNITQDDLIHYGVISSTYSAPAASVSGMGLGSVVVTPTVLHNPWGNRGQDVSVIGDGSGNAVLTWEDDSTADLWYAWVSSDGTVLTPPRVYWTSYNNLALSGSGGQGNGGMAIPSVILPQLTITKSAASQVYAGELLTYTITVSETTGAADATGVVVTDTVPVSSTFQRFGGDYYGSIFYVDSTALVSWSNLKITEGTSIKLHFVVKVSEMPTDTSFYVTNDQYRVTSSEQGVTTGPGGAIETLVGAKDLYLPIVRGRTPYTTPIITTTVIWP